jgi:hypothetical protein
MSSLILSALLIVTLFVSMVLFKYILESSLLYLLSFYNNFI